MEKKKRYTRKQGDIFIISLSNNKRVFARIIGIDIGIYDFVDEKNNSLPSTENIIKYPIFLYCSIFNDTYRLNGFEKIGNILLTQQDFEKVPPRYTQDIVNFNCTIQYRNGTSREALPHECIGLEPNQVWNGPDLIDRIEDHYAGRKNLYVEMSRVILSEADPRFRHVERGTLKWDFEKRELYLEEDT